MRTLFGTDGIRGVAGEPPLDRQTIYATGLALAADLRGQVAGPRVLLGRDTRESGPWISALLASGLRAGGVAVVSAGVIPTPGVAHLAHTHGFAAGIVISASHNPWQDNGIKIFGGDGYKLPDDEEFSIEQEIYARREGPAPDDSPLLRDEDSFFEDYAGWLRSQVQGHDFSGLELSVDCANGAASDIAPELLRSLGAEVRPHSITPDGRNINQNCGALHPEVVAKHTLADGSALGITFDGDADRALFASRSGRVINGDAVLLLTARRLQRAGELAQNTVVATTMSNMGLEAALRSSDIRMLRAPVGDKYVLEQMRATGAMLGGEQSGHVIFLDRATTGDGLLTALMFLSVLAEGGGDADALLADLKTYPQVIENIRVREKVPLSTLPEVQNAIAAAEQELDGTGRVNVRYSGTEKLARVMVEAESDDLMRRHANAIAAALRDAIGE